MAFGLPLQLYASREDLDALEAAAMWFAAGAHMACGQKRKYTGEDYIRHPANVRSICRKFGVHNSFALAACWLHDVVEDTDVTFQQLDALFPHAVCRLVHEVTEISRPEDGNRAVRKAIDLEHYKKASNFGQAIKVADLIDNTESIVQHDPDFARVYLKEKQALLQVLVLAPDPMLNHANDQLALALRRLEELDAPDAP